MAKDKKKKPMGPALKRFIKKHKRFPKTPKERKEAGCMTKKDKARSRSRSPKKKKPKHKKTKKTKTKKTKKTKPKKRSKSRGVLFK